MKKIMIGVLSLVMCFTLVGCSSKEEEKVNPQEETNETSVYDDVTEETEDADEYDETADYNDESYVEEYEDYTGEEQYYD